jgi:hypothetical protein
MANIWLIYGKPFWSNSDPNLIQLRRENNKRTKINKIVVYALDWFAKIYKKVILLLDLNFKHADI